MLKRNFWYSLLLLLLSINSSAAGAQSADEVIEILKNSMTNGNAANISEYFDNTVDITFDNSHSTYSKTHAVVVLNDFYTKNHPQSFKIEYKGKSAQSDAQYVIGTVYTSNGEYKVYLYIKKKGAKQVIQEMKIGK